MSVPKVALDSQEAYRRQGDWNIAHAREISDAIGRIVKDYNHPANIAYRKTVAEIRKNLGYVSWSRCR